MDNPKSIIRIAVTGHRPPRINTANEPAIRASVRAILEHVLTVIGQTPSPALRILSALAEGSDRIAAEEALALRDRCTVTLECPLPAPHCVYREDFKSEESRKAFCNLLTAASAVFELDGEREGDWLRSSDYGRAGRIAASNCDLLIAIWDGRPGEGGGTAEIARGAMLAEIPTVRIDVDRPENITVCAGHDEWETDWKAALKRTLPPAFEPPPSAGEWMRRYFGEKAAGPDDDTRADTLASRYGHLYRASYRLKYGLAALAVLFAVAGLMPGQRGTGLWPALELACIAGVLLCFLLAWKGKWHELWLDYRLLAEQFRVLRFLQPLGETVPVFRAPRYWGVPTERHACVRWYFRARLRECGLPHASATRTYIDARRAEVLDATQGQLRYNEKKHANVGRMHKIMEWTGIALFIVTAGACFFHLVDWGAGPILAATTAILPAFGAAMEGLQAQEEGKRIAGNTGAMAEHMKTVAERIRELPNDVGLGKVSPIAFELATEMTRETSGWHNLIHVQRPRV